MHNNHRFLFFIYGGRHVLTGQRSVNFYRKSLSDHRITSPFTFTSVVHCTYSLQYTLLKAGKKSLDLVKYLEKNLIRIWYPEPSPET